VAIRGAGEVASSCESATISGDEIDARSCANRLAVIGE
jgi:hypothetical protein